MAPVVRALGAPGQPFVVEVCATAQHRELLDEVFERFGITAQHDLNVMQPRQSLSQVASRVLLGMETVIAASRPDWVLVQGDTTSVAAAALAAFHHRVRVAHVEAGLRTHDKWAPFPEEMNRRLAGAIADLHFAPTEGAGRALAAEGVPSDTVHITGNTAIDALLWMRDLVRAQPPERPAAWAPLNGASRLLLVTLHRRENWPHLGEVAEAIASLVDGDPALHVVFPVHPNPVVREAVTGPLKDRDRVILTAPQPYDRFVWLLDRASVILTDSGGIQEEAPSLGKPVLVAREVTERPEGITVGNARLVGTCPTQIAASIRALFDDPALYRSMTGVANPYGDGRAAERIADILART